MGTHPSVPSKNASSGETLRNILGQHPELLGDKIVEKFEGELPFLFKVLSIKKVLSIQAHPDKKLGAILHASDPKNYPDANHKPEMAIAITAFEGFCGFRPLEEITEFLNNVPELVELVGEQEAENFKSVVSQTESVDQKKKALQSLFAKVMNTSPEKIADESVKLVERAKSEGARFGGSAGGEPIANLILRLNEQFPKDVGLFCGCLLLNYVTLNPGEAVYMQANYPHAYISGDIIECMAASDNVVRSGFTPKFKDVPNLVKMLTYTYDPPSAQKMEPAQFERASGEGLNKLYDPPIAEFSVLETQLDQGEKAQFKGVEGPSIVIVTKGNGTISLTNGDVNLEAKMGYVFYIAPGSEVSYEGTTNGFTTYRAFCEA